EADGALRARVALTEKQLLQLIDEGKAGTHEYEALQDDLLQTVRQRADNPAIVYSEEEADTDFAAFVGRAKATAAAVRVREVFQEEGVDAALAELQAIYDDQNLAPDERLLAGNMAREEVNRRLTLENQRRNETEARRNALERQTHRLMD